MEILLTIIIAIVVASILLLYTMAIWGLVCWKFWYWFVLPIFPALPQIEYYQAIGLLCFMCLFRNQSMKTIKTDKINEYTYMILDPWLILLSGYIVKYIIL